MLSVPDPRGRGMLIEKFVEVAKVSVGMGGEEGKWEGKGRGGGGEREREGEEGKGEERKGRRGRGRWWREGPTDGSGCNLHVPSLLWKNNES